MLQKVIKETEFKSYFRRVFFLSLVFHALAAWFSAGFHHYDEHFQLLEFAAQKAGIVAENTLPWEFKAEIRPSLQPWIAFSVIRFLQFLNLHDPFLAAIILRIFAAIIGWFSSLILTLTFLQYFKSDHYKKIFIAISALLWFSVYLHIRFSSESLSTSFFWLGISVLLFQTQKSSKNTFRFLLSGILLGIAVVLRTQIILMAAGAFLWMLLLGKYTWKQLSALLFGGVLAVLFGAWLDYLFYGHWANTAYNYFTVNILQDKTSQFGVSAWYYYFWAFLRFAQAPMSYLLLPLIVWSWIKFPKSIITWTCLAFIIPHIFIGHKEFRFIFPLIPAIPVLISLLHQYYLQKQQSIFFKGDIWRNWFKIIVIVVTIQNFIMLIFYILQPLQPLIKPLQIVYNDSDPKKEGFLLADEYFYGNDRGFLFDSEMRYFMQPKTRIIRFRELQEVQNITDTCSAQVYILLGSNNLKTFTDNKPYVRNAKVIWQNHPFFPQDLKIEGKGTYTDVNTTTSIKGRGNSTWGYAKKPYRLKLDSKTSIFGLPKAKNWVLLANYLDPTLMLNSVALKAGQLLSIPYTNSFVPVDVSINGKYMGCYLFTEQV
ncbi:MAG: hypothetical protein EOP53_09330, partial [Sphingobacteriales bacterium]